MDMLLKPNSLLKAVQASNWLGEIGERGYYFGYALAMFKNWLRLGHISLTQSC